jgi:hypothetical protein
MSDGTAAAGPKPLKILRLTHSGHTNSSAPPEQRAEAILRQMMMEATGEEVEIVSRVIWPAPELPGILDRWIRKEQPDIVYLTVNQFWYAFASVPVKLERLLGRRGGEGVSRVGRKLSRQTWLAGSRPFKLGRRVALKLIGGAYYFEIDEVEQTVRDCVRVILRYEDVIPVVHSAARLTQETPTGVAPGWSDERRRELNARLRKMFAELHIIGRALDQPTRPINPEHKTLIDRDGHPNARGQMNDAGYQFPWLLLAWQRLRGIEPDQAQAG